MLKMIQLKNRSGRAALGLTLGLSLAALSACDRLLEVDLPRPRDFRSVTRPEFVELKARLLAPLHEESSRQVRAVSEGPLR